MCLMLIIFISASTRTQTRGRERNFLLPDSLQRILGKYNYNPNLPQTFYDSHCQGQHPPLRWRPSDLAMILASIQATRDYSRPPRFSVWHILSLHQSLIQSQPLWSSWPHPPGSNSTPSLPHLPLGSPVWLKIPWFPQGSTKAWWECRWPNEHQLRPHWKATSIIIKPQTSFHIYTQIGRASCRERVLLSV